MFNKLSKILLLAASLIMFNSTSFSEVGIGVTGIIAKINAEGSETEGTAADTSTRNAEVDNVVAYGSIYLENTLDNGLTVGLEYVPFSADVSDATHERSDTSVAGSGEGVTGTNTRKADAEVENFRTIYAEIPVKRMYLRVGFSQIDVNTKENALTNGGTYGDATLDGYNIGVGVKGTAPNGLNTKLSLEYVDFEDLSLSSSTNNSINADLDMLNLKLAIGKSF